MTNRTMTGAEASVAAQSMRQVVVNNETWEVMYWCAQPPGLWVMSYPNSEFHGGGPPRLELTSEEALASRLQHHGWVANEPNVVVELLVDRWCERRALGPLRCVLTAWPNFGLTDGYGALRNALANVRSISRGELDSVDTELAHLAQNGIEKLLDRK